MLLHNNPTVAACSGVAGRMEAQLPLPHRFRNDCPAARWVNLHLIGDTDRPRRHSCVPLTKLCYRLADVAVGTALFSANIHSLRSASIWWRSGVTERFTTSWLIYQRTFHCQTQSARSSQRVHQAFLLPSKLLHNWDQRGEIVHCKIPVHKKFLKTCKLFDGDKFKSSLQSCKIVCRNEMPFLLFSDALVRRATFFFLVE